MPRKPHDLSDEFKALFEQAIRLKSVRGRKATPMPEEARVQAIDIDCSHHVEQKPKAMPKAKSTSSSVKPKMPRSEQRRRAAPETPSSSSAPKAKKQKS